MKTILLTLFLLSAAAIRWLRWVALVQQKEYRLDRLQSFLVLPEGRLEILRILPKLADFSRTGLKRPRLTARALVVAGLSLFLMITFILTINWFFPFMINGWQRLLLIAISFGLMIVFTPMFVLLSALPTVWLAELRTLLELWRARRIFQLAKPKVVGITGSYGKSTAKHLLNQVLARKYKVFATPRSYNARFSVAASIVSGYQGEELAILEYGAYSRGEIAELAGWLPPNLAVITGLAPQHLALFGNLENIVAAKAELVKALPTEGTVYYNAADPGAKQIVDRGVTSTAQLPSLGASDTPSKRRVVACDIAQTGISNVKINHLGQLSFSFGKRQVQTQLVGKHFLTTVALVIKIAQDFGIEESEIASALEAFVPVGYMMTSYELANGTLVIDDGGTSNPAGFAAALTLVQELGRQDITLITPGIVDLGKASASEHQQLARLARKSVKKILHVGQDGAREFAEVFDHDYIDDASAIEATLSQLNSSDLLLIEGKMPGWVDVVINRLKARGEPQQL
jgi:UDP-N-acetylmuramoyl-tripeptide--D-alanyl-D-alanine ligase